MKHTFRITLLLLLIFVLAQFVGLAIVGQYIDVEKSAAAGKTQIREEEYVIEPPRLENENISFIYIVTAIIIGTLLVLILIRFRKKRVWKAWYLLSVVICLTMAFAPIVKKFINSLFPSLLSYYVNITLLLAIILGIWKITNPNILIHNLTEVFIYGGIAALLVPIINLVSGFALLICMSIYDAYAVWRSKHMVKMAKFQSSTKVFAGLFIPYKKGTKTVVGKIRSKSWGKVAKAEPVNAILGGGDIAFPLLFSSAVLKTTGFYIDAVIITIFATIALFTLFYFSKPDRFYPAMPMISLGCFLGFVVSLFI